MCVFSTHTGFLYFRDVPNRWKAAGPPPHNITAVKGGIHVALSRPFVDFAINNKLAKDLLEWCRKVEIPDELFFSTLHNNPQLNIPGSYKGMCLPINEWIHVQER